VHGIHDIGGMHGLGRVQTEENEPPFHAPWEGRMHGIAVTCQVSGINTTPEQRMTIENISPSLYLSTSYYEKWLYAYETILARKGVVSREEIDRRVAEQSDEKMIAHPVEPETLTEYGKKLRHVLYNGTPHDRPTDVAPMFKTGDKVRAKVIHADRHTRLPAFTMGKVGTVKAYHGAHCSHEALAAGDGDVPVHLYAVKFPSTELWGEDGEDGDAVHVDLFEMYLEPAV
jgi:nitrile hydratase beta subunit